MTRKYFALIYILLLGVKVHAQTPDDATAPATPSTLTTYNLENYNSLNTSPIKLNYVRNYAPLIRISGIDSYNVYKTRVSTIYQNGWGNPIEIVKRGGAGYGDVITPIDQRSSMTRYTFLPYTGDQSGGFRFNPFNDQHSYFTASTHANHNEQGFSFSTNQTILSSNFVINKSCSPGLSLSGGGNGTTNVTAYNLTADGLIYKLDINAGYAHVAGTYPENEIAIKETVGQHGQIREYYDRNQRLIAKKVNTGSQWSTTYYVYKDNGKLAWILPPAVWNTVTGLGWTLAWPQSDMCYYYEYNEYGHMTRKHVPDQSGDYYSVFDKMHRSVLQQTPLLKSQNKWSYSIFDAQNRIRFSGITTSTNTPAQWATALGTTPTAGTLLDYLKNGFKGTYPGTLTSTDINIVNYYDDYSSLPSPLSSRSPVTTYNGDLFVGAGFEWHLAKKDWAYGQLIATRTRVLDPTNTNLWVNTVYFYDEFDRLVQTHTLNPWNTTDWDINVKQYSFSGNIVLDINETHSWSTAKKTTTLVKTWFDYHSTTNRLMAVKQKVDANAWRDIASYAYDDQGRVLNKLIGGVENQNYSYNIRGQLTSINDNHVKSDANNTRMTYGEDLAYDYGFSNKRYDGSIAGFIWRGSGVTLPRAYGYTYDYSSRITDANFTRRLVNYNISPVPPSPIWKNDSVDYSVSGITYDANGNMTAMKQRGTSSSGPADIDNLIYHYSTNTNRLDSIRDIATYHITNNDFLDGNVGSTDYNYDADGNMTQDKNKGITNITYNYMDLATMVRVGASNTINNIYDASGNQLQKTIKEGAVTNVYRYWGQYVYRNDSLLYILNDEGRTRYIASNNSIAMDFFIKDHLGNVRTEVNSELSDFADANVNTATLMPGGVNPTHEYQLTFEVLSANTESALFTNVDSMRQASPLGNPTDLMSGVLKGDDPAKRIGAAIVLHGMTGDAITFKAYGYYASDDSSDMHTYSLPENMMSSLLSTLQGGTNGLDYGDQGSIPGINTSVLTSLVNTTNYNVYEGLKNSITDPAYPRTYLNLLVFDELMNLIPAQCNVVQLKGSANSWNLMDGNSVYMQQPGYAVIYLSNESKNKSYVDNEHIYTVIGHLLDEKNYYPHGLHIDNGIVTTFEKNNYLYQTKKLQPELGLNLYDFHARQYDAQIGRFWGIDPMDQFPSGYTGMANDPANSIDPTGMKGVRSQTQLMHDNQSPRGDETWDNYGASHGRGTAVAYNTEDLDESGFIDDGDGGGGGGELSFWGGTGGYSSEDLATEDPTRVYNESGENVKNIDDGLNVIVIVPDQYSNLAASCNSLSSLTFFGTAYDMDGVDKLGSSVDIATTFDHNDIASFWKFQVDGKSFPTLHSEMNVELKMIDGMVRTVGSPQTGIHDAVNADGYFTYSAHSHTMEGSNFSYLGKGTVGGGSVMFGPSTSGRGFIGSGDMNKATGNLFRNIIVTPNNYYFYNSNNYIQVPRNPYTK
jgi:RHS repeat-associated protein